MGHITVLLIYFCAVVSAQLLPITSLPGLAALPPWNMYSGYVNYVSPTFGSTHSIFSWVAESQNDPATDPILFWTNVSYGQQAERSDPKW